MLKTKTVRVLKFWANKISKYAGDNKPYLNISEFVTAAVKEKIERLERKKN